MCGTPPCLQADPQGSCPHPYGPPPQREQSLGPWACPHLKDLKTRNVQDADEELTGQLGVQRLVDPRHQPSEQPVVGGLGQSLQRNVRLQGGVHSEDPACPLAAPVLSPGGWRRDFGC